MSDNQIVVLRGPDRIRKRPAVVFGSDGRDGAVNAFKMVINLFLGEAVKGNCKKLSVRLCKDGSAIIKSYDKGFLLDETEIEGKPAWHYDFCELYTPGKDGEAYIFDVGEAENHFYGKSTQPKYRSRVDFNFDMCCIQYICEFMNVEAVREGVKKTLKFKGGFSVSGLEKEKNEGESYTKLHFKIDSSVFEDTTITYHEASQMLKEAAIMMAGLVCVITDEATEKSEEFVYCGGIEDFLKRETNGYASTPIFTNEIEARGKERYNKPEYDARVKTVFCFSNKKAMHLCYHNFENLSKHGLHFKAAKEKISRYFSWMFGDEKDITAEQMLEKAWLIVESNCTNTFTEWRNGARNSIENKVIIDMTSDLFDDDFNYYLKQNREQILKICKEEF